MKKLIAALSLGAACLSAAQSDAPARLQAAADVFKEVMRTPDKAIPQDLLNKSQCVIIVPGLKKAAFLVGGDYGRGYSLCRHTGGWTGPAAIKFGGGSFGAQIGVESTDVIMLVMDRKGMEKLAADKFTVGADASAAAGPVGRTAQADTDASLHAEILSYSRAHGAFAGVALDGTVVSKDGGEDKKLYGMEVENRAILHGDVPAPPAATPLMSLLDMYKAKPPKS